MVALLVSDGWGRTVERETRTELSAKCARDFLHFSFRSYFFLAPAPLPHEASILCRFELPAATVDAPFKCCMEEQPASRIFCPQQMFHFATRSLEEMRGAPRASEASWKALCSQHHGQAKLSFLLACRHCALVPFHFFPLLFIPPLYSFSVQCSVRLALEML